jgi:hypothetical protein
MKPWLKEFLRPRLTYTELAREYGCTIAFVCHIANGRRKAPARFKMLCSKKLGLPISVIFPESSEDNAGKT